MLLVVTGAMRLKAATQPVTDHNPETHQGDETEYDKEAINSVFAQTVQHVSGT